MYKSIDESVAFAENLIKLGIPDNCQVIICAPFTALHAISGVFRESAVSLGAQNMHHLKEGAYTGEISSLMIKDAGCRYVILGHSERRQFFGETDRGVSEKLASALDRGICPIVCVGEVLDEREAGDTQKVVEAQVRGSLDGLDPGQAEEIIIAYEPVWAIGTGRTASDGDAQQVISFIRQILFKMFGREASEKIRILYGGSVKPDNAAGLMEQPDIDGALVGGASLDVKSFASIIEASVKAVVVGNK